MLYQEMCSLADQLDAGELSPTEAAAKLRGLARHTPDEQCRQVLSFSTYLAMVDETWTWIVNDDPGFCGGTKLISNRFSKHPSNLETVIDFMWWEPEDIDKFGRALVAAAEIVDHRKNADDD